MQKTCLFVTLVAIASSPALAPASVEVEDTGWLRAERELSGRHLLINPDHPRHRARAVNLRSGKARYQLNYAASTDTDGQLHAQGIGLVPTANWSSNGFMDVRVNGETLFTTHPTWAVESTGRKATVTMTFEKAFVTVTLTFALRDKSNKLQVTTTIEDASEAVESVKTRLTCYPSDIAKNFGNAATQPERDRRLMTPRRIVQHRPEPFVLKGNEFWVLYYDRYWDSAKGRGKGPCGLLFSPGKPKKVKVHLRDSPAIRTVLSYPASTRKFDLVVVEFHGLSNKKAKSRMKSFVRGN